MGYRVLVMLKRGHGGTPLTTPKMQSFGDPHDLRHVVLLMRERYPDSRVACIGNTTIFFISDLKLQITMRFSFSSELDLCFIL